MYISKAQIKERHEATKGSQLLHAGKSISISKASRQKVLRHFERCLKTHLSFSLEKVFTKADGYPILSDGESLLPDIWVATIARDPVRTRSIVEAGLIVEIQPTAAKASAFFSELRASRKISSVREIVVISLADRAIEIFRRTGPRNWAMEDYSDRPFLHLQCIDLDVPLDQLWGITTDLGLVPKHIRGVNVWRCE